MLRCIYSYGEGTVRYNYDGDLFMDNLQMVGSGLVRVKLFTCESKSSHVILFTCSIFLVM